MTCDQCGSSMVNVGRQIKPGHPDIWMDGWVCPERRCPGYAASDHMESVSRWPGMTLLAEAPLHANIRGALKFRDAQP